VIEKAKEKNAAFARPRDAEVITLMMCEPGPWNNLVEANSPTHWVKPSRHWPNGGTGTWESSLSSF
jgi:hypothetical protein